MGQQDFAKWEKAKLRGFYYYERLLAAVRVSEFSYDVFIP